MIAKIQLFIIVVLLTLVAACGSGSDSDSSGSGVTGQSADELLSNAKSQLTDAKTVRISGAGTDGGSKIKLDMTYSGKTAAGSITLNGGEIRLLKAKGHSYFKGSDAFYRQVAGKNVEQFKQVVNGRWILIDEKSKDFNGLSDFVDRKTFFGGFVKQLNGKLSKGKEARIRGVECLSLRDSSGTLWVNADNGNLVRLVTDEGQALNFDYRRVQPAKPPKAEDVFDLASLS
jgi:hypothetical protein